MITTEDIKVVYKKMFSYELDTKESGDILNFIVEVIKHADQKA
jgi:hypothetical protein